MAITIKNISKASDNRLRITVEDSSLENKTYSFYVQAGLPEGEKAVDAKIQLEKVIAKEKRKVSDDEALIQMYASELSKVDPSKIVKEV